MIDHLHLMPVKSCSTRKSQPSLFTNANEGKVMFSMHFDTTYEDIANYSDTIINVLNKLIKNYTWLNWSLDQLKEKRYFITFEPHRNAKRIGLHDQIGKHATPVKRNGHSFFVIDIWFYEEAKKECTRCGLCCIECRGWPPYQTPLTKKRWIGQGEQGRCMNLHFDTSNGVYSCEKVNERSPTCERFICDAMRGREDIAARFGKEPMPINRRYPISITVEAEWFIAYARNNALTTKDLSLGLKIKDQLKHREENAGLPRECSKIIDPKFADQLIQLIDEMTCAS